MYFSDDSLDRLNYKGQSEFFRERKFRAQEPERKTDKEFLPKKEVLDVSELREKFRDLKVKAEKLEEVIDDNSMALSIPIDKEKQPKVSFAVAQLDPGSQGEFLSYNLYNEIMDQQRAGASNIDLDWMLNNSTDDLIANSDILLAKYYEGMARDTRLNKVEISDGGPDQMKVYGNIMLNSITSWNEHEFHVRQIVNWSQGWLFNNPDPAYIPWTFKDDMKKKIMEYESIDDMLGIFSDLTGDLSKSFSSLSSPLSLPKSLWDSLSGKADNDNNFFNQINEIFSMNYGADLICCLVAWSGGLDNQTLYALRMALQLASNGIEFEFGDIKSMLTNVANMFLRNMISGQLIAILEMLRQTVTDPIYRWLNTDDERWRRIFLCTPIDEAINIYVLGAIEKLEQILQDKILEFMKKIELDHDIEDNKIEKAKKNKSLQDLIDILDTVIAAVGKSTQCGLHMAPSTEHGGVPYGSLGAGPRWWYKYPEEDNPNRYNSFFITEETISEEEVFDKDTGESTGKKRVLEDVNEKVFLGTIPATREKAVNIDDCLKKGSDEYVFSVREWMEDLRAKASEGN